MTGGKSVVEGRICEDCRVLQKEMKTSQKETLGVSLQLKNDTKLVQHFFYL